MKIILWADEVDHCEALMLKLRADGHKVMSRDARYFGGSGDAEAAEAIGFINATKQAQILNAYRSEGYAERHGRIKLLDIPTGEFGEPIGKPDIEPVPQPAAQPTEKDLLSDRIANMSDDDLRQFVRGVTGGDVAADATRADLEALLRPGTKPAAQAPANPPAPVSAEAEAKTSAETPPPPAASEPTEKPADAAGEKSKAAKPGKAKPAS